MKLGLRIPLSPKFQAPCKNKNTNAPQEIHFFQSVLLAGYSLNSFYCLNELPALLLPVAAEHDLLILDERFQMNVFTPQLNDVRQSTLDVFEI